jgi:hypothetical protein
MLDFTTLGLQPSLGYRWIKGRSSSYVHTKLLALRVVANTQTVYLCQSRDSVSYGSKEKDMLEATLDRLLGRLLSQASQHLASPTE